MMSASRRVVYMSSKEYHMLCNKHPKVKDRASITDSLINAYGLKSCLVNVIPETAAKEDLMKFHSEDYVNCLEKIQQLMEENYPPMKGEDSMYEEDIDYDNDEEFGEVTKYGFGYDCGVFLELYDYCKAVVGATIGAAKILTRNKADIAINLNGGWHHAHVDEAAGFCYVNDVVIGILTLMDKFKKILYVDLDIHHGDGVEEAFLYSKKVLTLSLHNYEHGFFPGTGGGDEFHQSCKKHLAANIPLKNGIDDKMFMDVFNNVFGDIILTFQPEVIVCQCGADGLTGDPMGAFNLTSNALASCVEKICSTKVPVMILGGGGYNVPNTARCWTEIVARILGKTLVDDIPEHDYLDRYGPDYTLNITPGNRRNENSEEYITGIIKLMKENIPAENVLTQQDVAASDDAEKSEEVNDGALQDTTNLNEMSETVFDKHNSPISDRSAVEDLKSKQLVSGSCSGKRVFDENNPDISLRKACKTHI